MVHPQAEVGQPEGHVQHPDWDVQGSAQLRGQPHDYRLFHPQRIRKGGSEQKKSGVSYFFNFVIQEFVFLFYRINTRLEYFQTCSRVPLGHRQQSDQRRGEGQSGHLELRRGRGGELHRQSRLHGLKQDQVNLYFC